MAASPERAALLERYRAVRQASLDMCEPLCPEEYRIQPMAEVSPPWWNLGHTSWFFVRNVLARLLPFSQAARRPERGHRGAGFVVFGEVL
jgi:hypothetical protein